MPMSAARTSTKGQIKDGFDAVLVIDTSRTLWNERYVYPHFLWISLWGNIFDGAAGYTYIGPGIN
jgi:hypothetical protein